MSPKKKVSPVVGEGVVDELAGHIAASGAGARGFSRQNLFRMRPFFEGYRDAQKVSPLVRQLPWPHNLIVLSQSRSHGAGLFEQAVLHLPKVSSLLRQMHPEASTAFKDAYFLDFLELAQWHSEGHLHGGIRQNLQHFILEMGRDFAFVGSDYPLQVGGRDFAGRFEPEHLGKLQFYLEALDRDVKK